MYDSSAFIVHPENQAFLERKADYPASLSYRLESGCMLLFITPFVFLGVVMLAFSVNLMRGHILLAQNSVTVQGWVEGREIINDDGIIYYVRYIFYVNDQAYQRKQAVSKEVYEAHQPNDPIEIVYATDDPTISHPTEANSLVLDLSVLGFSLAWLGMACLLFYGTLQAQMQRRRLRKQGQLVRGKIADIRDEVDMDSDYHLYLTASFHAPDTAQSITQKRHYQPNEIKNRRLPPIDTPIYIFYLNEKMWEVL